jgi:hypothetical protein
MTAEIWLVTGFESHYQVSNHGRVRSLERTIIRANGIKYTVAARVRRIGVDRRCGLRYVALATGRRGRYRTVYIRRLMADVFGGDS